MKENPSTTELEFFSCWPDEVMMATTKPQSIWGGKGLLETVESKPLLKARSATSWLPRAISSWASNISRDEDSKAFLINLFQYSNTPLTKKKKKSVFFRKNFSHFSFCLLPLLLSIDTTEKILARSSLYFLSDIYYKHWKDHLWSHINAEFSQPLLVWAFMSFFFPRQHNRLKEITYRLVRPSSNASFPW